MDRVIMEERMLGILTPHLQALPLAGMSHASLAPHDSGEPIEAFLPEFGHLLIQPIHQLICLVGLGVLRFLLAASIDQILLPLQCCNISEAVDQIEELLPIIVDHEWDLVEVILAEGRLQVDAPVLLAFICDRHPGIVLVHDTIRVW